MKHLILDAICTGDIEEAWTFAVPDDFDISGEPGEVFERAMGEHQSPDGVTLVGVTNLDANDERDRKVRAFSLTDPPPPPRSTITDGIVYLEAGTRDLEDLKAAVDWCILQGRHLRIQTEVEADGTSHLKYKAGEGGWTPPIRSHLPNGGYPTTTDA